MPILSLPRRARRRSLAVTAALALATFGLVAGVSTSTAAVSKSVPRILQTSAKNVTADGLPTAQVDGVVWKQAIAGNTVFAGGRFSNARPAGVALGGAGTTPRLNLMSYDIRTGKMTSFAPKLSGGLTGSDSSPLYPEVLALALSPDKKILYVGGNFTKVGTKNRAFFAAFTVSTGKLRALNPKLKAPVRAIATVGKTVYLGGDLKSINGKSRPYAGAIIAKTGAVKSWKPTPNASVEALLVNPAKSRVILGGHFSTLRGKAARGMGAVTTVGGWVRPWKVNTKIQDYGPNAAILDLVADKDTVYGAAYGYQSGNFEGVFAVSPTAGNIRWLQDCHGDQYGVAPIGDLVYSVGHAHFCKNIGGFPEVSPQRTLVVTKAAKGTIAHNTQTDNVNYYDWSGNKAPAIYNWFPKLNSGNVSGQHQGAWSIKGTSKYIVLGGEFTTVNGVAQQGLVRFTTPANGAPGDQGPVGSSAGMTPSVTTSDSTGRTLSWRSNYDLDDHTLTYKVLRDGKTIATFNKNATYWSRPQITWKDKTAKVGVGYRYQIYVRDGDDNAVRSVVLYSR